MDAGSTLHPCRYATNLALAPVALAVATRPERLTRFTAEGVDGSRRVDRHADGAVQSLVAGEAGHGHAFADSRGKPDRLVVARVAELDIQARAVIQREAQPHQVEGVDDAVDSGDIRDIRLRNAASCLTLG